MRRDVFQAIADPTRRAILLLIALQTLTPNAIACHFDSSRQSISKHLKILTECELLSAAQKGREIYYSINYQNMKEIDEYLSKIKTIWENRFTQLDQIISKIK